MLQGERVRLRGITRDDLPRMWAFNNDLAVELAGGGDPPYPQSLARLQAEFDADTAKGGRDATRFAIETEGQCIGFCGLFNVDATGRTSELGIAIGAKEHWGHGFGREAVRGDPVETDDRRATDEIEDGGILPGHPTRKRTAAECGGRPRRLRPQATGGGPG